MMAGRSVSWVAKRVMPWSEPPASLARTERSRPMEPVKLTPAEERVSLRTVAARRDGSWMVIPTVTSVAVAAPFGWGSLLFGGRVGIAPARAAAANGFARG